VRTTFESTDHWVKEFSLFDNENCVLYLVGNKSDLEAAIEKAEVEEWADAKGIKFFLVSAKTGTGINEMFQYVAEDLAVRRPAIVHQFDKSTMPEPKGPQAREDCC
jgi:GTPase SAR1 family protein